MGAPIRRRIRFYGRFRTIYSFKQITRLAGFAISSPIPREIVELNFASMNIISLDFKNEILYFSLANYLIDKGNININTITECFVVVTIQNEVILANIAVIRIARG